MVSAVKVELASKQVGQWGFVVILKISREASETTKESIVHHVVVTTEVFKCNDPEARPKKIETFSWEITENYGDAVSLNEQIHFFGLGKEYGSGERIILTVKGEWWIQKVQNPGKPKTKKS